MIDLSKLDREPQGERNTDGDVWAGRGGIQHVGKFGLHDNPQDHEHQRYVWVEAMIEQYAPNRNTLDVGCNIGEVIRVLLDDGIVTLPSYGLDIDKEYIEVARQRVPSVKFFHRALEFAAQCDFPPLGVVIAFDVLEHVFDPVRALGVFAELLAPAGVLFITTPDATPWAYGYAEAHPDLHRHVFDAETLSGLLKDVGLRVVDIQRSVPRYDGYTVLLMAAQKEG